MQKEPGSTAADAVIPISAGSLLRNSGIDQSLIELPVTIQIFLISCYLIEFSIYDRRSDRTMAETQIEDFISAVFIWKIDIRDDLRVIITDSYLFQIIDASLCKRRYFTSFVAS